MTIADYPFKDPMPSDKYFDIIKNLEDYEKFIASGMAWEWEPDCPNTWSRHLELVEKRRSK